MRKLYVVALALIILLSVTMSAVALTSKTIYRQNGESASASWTAEALDFTTETYLSVTQSDVGNDIYISICTYDMSGSYLSCKSGYKLTPENVFSMHKKLNSAKLESVEIELSQWNCDENGCWETFEGIATIEATWTGTGDVSKNSYKWTDKYGGFISRGSSSSSYREATAEGTLNNVELGTSNFGGVTKFKYADMQMQK
jgi:hypothetical protein